MANGSIVERDMRTLKVSDVDPEKVTEDLLYELFSQFGVVTDIRWHTEQRDMARNQQAAANRKSVNGFNTNATFTGATPALLNDQIKSEMAFVEYRTSADAEYAFEVLKDCRIQLFQRDIRVTFKGLGILERLASTGGTLDVNTVDRKGGVGLFDIGAKLYVSNFKRSLTAKELTDFFTQFGVFAAPLRLITDRDGLSKGACVISYQQFADSDKVLDEMQGQIFHDMIIRIEYADLGDGTGRKHGSSEERQRALAFMEQEQTHNATIAASSEIAAQRTRTEENSVPAWARGVAVTSTPASVQQRSVYGRV